MGTGDSGQNASISVTSHDVERLRALPRQQWGREPGAAELQGLVQDFVREEILVREARAQGLDRDDLIVRRRLAQKMEFLANQTVEPASEAELRAFHAAHAERYARVPMLSLEQQLVGHGASGESASTAPASMLSQKVTQADAERLAREFGATFAQAALRAPLGQWVGPVESPFGQHQLRVTQRSSAGVAPLDQVRAQVAADWMQQRLAEVREAHYAQLRKKYAVDLPTEVAQGALPTLQLSAADAQGIRR